MPEKEMIINEMMNEFENQESSKSKIDYLFSKVAELKQFQENISSQLSNLNNQLENSELFFSMPEINLMTRSKLPHVVIEAGDVVPIGDNFYQAEPFGDNKHFRWTGPDRVNNFFVPIDRSIERTIRFKLVNAIKPEIISSIKMYIDGKLVKTDIEKNDSIYELITFLEPSERVQDTLVSIFIPHLFSPSELDDTSDDNRKIGIAFYELEAV